MKAKFTYSAGGGLHVDVEQNTGVICRPLSKAFQDMLREQAEKSEERRQMLGLKYKPILLAIADGEDLWTL